MFGEKSRERITLLKKVNDVASKIMNHFCSARFGVFHSEFQANLPLGTLEEEEED